MSYLKNAWYVAAWGSEITSDMLPRTLLDIPIVFYREEDGHVVALHDRCPHRFAPLSVGNRDGDGIRCGYHGLSFNKHGECVKSIFSDAVPKSAKVRPFQVVEQDALVWIWMGDAQPADIGTIPRFPHHNVPDECVFGTTLTRSNYMLLTDNLMDLSHTALLHPDLGGMDYIPKLKSWDGDDEVVARFVINDMPSFFEPGSNKLVDHMDEMHWYPPANHFLNSETTDQESNITIKTPSAHLLTPETETSTHYFWSSGYDPTLPLTKEDMRQALIRAFDHQDKPMVEAVQSRMGGRDLFDLDPILLPMDAGSVRVRRKLSNLIEKEQSGALVKELQ